MALKWTDVQDIGIELFDTHPEIDPLTVRFTDLHRYVRELPGFDDDPEKSSEKILESIQMVWYEEYKNR